MYAKDFDPALKYGATFDVSLEFASDQKLNFRDSGIYINSPADGKIKISADGTGTDDITLGGTITVSDDAIFNGTISAGDNITITDAKNIIVGTTTGTKIGTSTSQKIGFFNATPVVQQATTGTITGHTAGSGAGVTEDSTFTGDTGTTAYTIGDIVKALKNLGLIAA